MILRDVLSSTVRKGDSVFGGVRPRNAGARSFEFPIVLFLAVSCSLFFVGCGTEPPPRWPWWTADDSAAVSAELTGWREVLSAQRAVTGAAVEGWRGRPALPDSSSETGDTLYKFARLLSVTMEPGAAGLALEYQFGVTVDTLPMGDTFCEVAYRDTIGACRMRLSYDSLWVVGYKQDTAGVYRVSYVELRGFDTPKEAVKEFRWTSMRKAFLGRDTLPDTLYYRLAKTTGFAAYVPSAADAPSINRIILSRPGSVDTVFYAPRADGRGLYNLKALDEIYTVNAGEEIGIAVTTTTPPDTVAEKNRFFISYGTTKKHVTANARRGEGTFSLSDVGYGHVYVEVVPLSNLLYPDSKYAGSFWAIPVRVVNP